jgi:Fe-S cluster assembly iron-binding protein IscA
MIEFTDWAVDILRRSHEAARRFNPAATVRVFMKGTAVQFELTDERREGDVLIEQRGFELFVEPGIEGTIDVVEPHDQLILRPHGATHQGRQ